jgi:murein DD-endopeptidase MepM/ murein hydrolase activator NlpD
VRHLLSATGALAFFLLPSNFPAFMELPGVPPRAVSLSEPLRTLQGRIARNSTLATMLDEVLSPAGIQHLVHAARPVYDLARVSVGHPFDIVLGPDGLVRVFTYGIDELRTLRVSRRGDELEAELVTRDYEVATSVASGTIESSLFLAVTESGEEDQLALDLAEIFAWDVDFNTEIQRGDSFRVAVEKLSLDGRFVRYGRILSAEFRRGERLLRAIRFEGSQGIGYYAPDGTPLRKAFLRSPLRFSRISSGFTRARFHPILRTTRPHLGVDYAARPGTPVMAAGNGVVTLAGWWGGYGKAVRIRHANGYETLYGHLSRISVRRGQRVSQGTPVGAVGSTGLATGPHLDYRMMRNGVFVNPLKIQSPPAEPIPAGELPAFASARKERLALLVPPRAPAQVAETMPVGTGPAGAAVASPSEPPAVSP